MTKFDFDEWSELYESNPDEFERKRKEFLNSEIQKAPVEHRSMLRTLQMECDAISKAVDNPLEAAAVITKMAVVRLQRLKGPLTELREICEDICEERRT